MGSFFPSPPDFPAQIVRDLFSDLFFRQLGPVAGGLGMVHEPSVLFLDGSDDLADDVGSFYRRQIVVGFLVDVDQVSVELVPRPSFVIAPSLFADHVVFVQVFRSIVSVYRYGEGLSVFAGGSGSGGIAGVVVAAAAVGTGFVVTAAAIVMVMAMAMAATVAIATVAIAIATVFGLCCNGRGSRDRRDR